MQSKSLISVILAFIFINVSFGEELKKSVAGGGAIK